MLALVISEVSSHHVTYSERGDRRRRAPALQLVRVGFVGTRRFSGNDQHSAVLSDEKRIRLHLYIFYYRNCCLHTHIHMNNMNYSLLKFTKHCTQKTFLHCDQKL